VRTVVNNRHEPAADPRKQNPSRDSRLRCGRGRCRTAHRDARSQVKWGGKLRHLVAAAQASRSLTSVGSPLSETDHRQLVFFPCIVVKGHEAARCAVSFVSLLSKNVSGLNLKGPSFSLILSFSHRFLGIIFASRLPMLRTPSFFGKSRGRFERAPSIVPYRRAEKNPRGFACKAARGHLGYWPGGNEDYLHG